ncbi:MAG: hypothetical protein QMB22_01030 [Dehalococcoidia bacterium]|jgi:hypothetical protein|nr:MAG: hypothetical protein DK305_000371 [Chloroflexota bacterium]|tara:strand:+ start:1532 stop:1828 length:297 start_codon:yes stop_codon:yes gene_type:complete
MIDINVDKKEISVVYEDLDVIGDQDTETFVLNLNFLEGLFPYYINIDKLIFYFSGRSFLVNGRSAMLPKLIVENESNNQLTLLVERENRFYIYLHDIK